MSISTPSAARLCAGARSVRTGSGAKGICEAGGRGPLSLATRPSIGELAGAHLTATVLGRLFPRPAGIAVADVDATHCNSPPNVGQMPQRRIGPGFVVTQEMQEDPFKVHLDRHASQPRQNRNCGAVR
jgi:hypothetical protein